jgi:hypothetical protein
LLEVARQCSIASPAVGVDIIFFDAEDWGKDGGGAEAEDSYALGTQYWTRQPHVPGYTASYGILLDMVGARDARFRQEGYSREVAGYVLEKVWSAAHTAGFGQYFLYEPGGWVTDDHVYVNRMGIPSIDIIGSDPVTGSGFGKHWHTHGDRMEGHRREYLTGGGADPPAGTLRFSRTLSGISTALVMAGVPRWRSARLGR